MTRLVHAAIALAAVALVLCALPVSAQPPCEQFGTGSGTIWLPPDCKYYSPNELHLIEDPVQQAVLLAKPIHQFFVCHRQSGGPGAGCNQPGGSLGGDVEQFDSELRLQIDGTGPLANYSRTVTVPNVAVEVHSGFQAPGNSQSFATDMVRIQGQLPAGDPHFAQLEIVGGTANGYPSPGYTSATYSRSSNTWTIQSQFEVAYQIRFVGAAGGPLDGYSGTFEGSVKMEAFGLDADDPSPQPSLTEAGD